MRRKSHRYLGEYLVSHYMPLISYYQQQAFLLGCVEPDQNPLTYLKGSLRHQCFRGHNYPNARRYIRQLIRRLEKKVCFSIYDYYSLGKLIHYTADAFTYPHNQSFQGSLHQHRIYETALQEYFLTFLQKSDPENMCFGHSPMETLHHYHRAYCSLNPNIHADARFTVTACRCILMQLVPNTVCPC